MSQGFCNSRGKKRMLCPIQIAGSDIVDQAVTNVQLNNYVFYMNNGRTLPLT